MRFSKCVQVIMIIETASEVLPENVSQRFLLKKISDRVSEIVNSLFLTNMEEKKIFFCYLGFLSHAYIIRRTAEERVGFLLNFSLPLPPTSHALTH